MKSILTLHPELMEGYWSSRTTFSFILEFVRVTTIEISQVALEFLCKPIKDILNLLFAALASENEG